MKKNCPILLLLIGLVFSALANNTKPSIAILFDHHNKSAAFTAAEMKKDLQKAGYMVNTINNKVQIRLILALSSTIQSDSFSLPPAEPQSYSIRKKGNDWYILASENKGLIYGGLDIAEAIKLNGLNSITNIDKTPYLQKRGIKFNIPLDARTPSYTDNGDSGQKNIANMWDMNFWHEFLDEMARDHYNVLSLWSLQPYPSLVKVPEYPNASLNDVKKTTVHLLPTSDGIDMSTPTSLAHLVTLKKITIDQKIKFWQDVMQYADDRGIECYLFTWNIFIDGLENSGYGFTDKSTDPKTMDYMRKATRTLLQTYPLLKGIGITAGENLKVPETDKEKAMYDIYGQGINDALALEPNRKFVLIHRAHQTNITLVKSTFTGLNPNCELKFSYKYSVAQMYSSVAPKFIYDEKFLDKVGDSHFFLTVRDDSWYYLRGGSDPDFARAYIKNMPRNGNLQGFYMGPDGYTWGREYVSREPDAIHESVIKKRWYSFGLMGKLAYDPNLSNAHFEKEIKDRFPEVDAQKLYTAWAKASQIFPTVTRFHNQRLQNDFEWYPEACTSYYGFQTIEKFITRLPQAGEGLLSIPVYTDALLNNKPIEGTTPFQIAQNLQDEADQALKLTAGMHNIKNKELRQTIDDIRAIAYLGQYYARKIAGATNKYLSDKSTDEAKKARYRSDAIKDLRAASANWKTYAAQMDWLYVPEHLPRLHITIDFKAMLAEVDKEVTLLENNVHEPTTPTRPQHQMEFVFSEPSHYYFWHLQNMSMPLDWSAYKYVVVDMYSTTPQKFNFLLNTNTDTLAKKGITPAPNKWIKVAVPLAYFKQQIAAKRGNMTVPVLSDVKGMGIEMDKYVGYPIIQTRAFTLVNDIPEGAMVVN
ncbi:MAG TPA: hypothetical protein VL490_02440 [Mucilaginibacter sp.]|jgi:hypothetical protein|nr:hypothetical protein [Mucilaginibacter sp.]